MSGTHSGTQLHESSKAVDFAKFQNEYWARLQRLRKSLTKDIDKDANLYWKEILLIQAGRKRTTKKVESAEDLCFTRDEYVNGQLDSFHGLSEEHRSDVYEKFREYKRMRAQRGEWDEAQFANQIFARILRRRQSQLARGDKVQAYEGRPISFLAVDECQDLLPRQLDVCMA